MRRRTRESGAGVAPRGAIAGARANGCPSRRGLLDGEDSLHASGGMTGNGAEVRVLALLEHDLQRGLILPGAKQRGLLSLDLEVVRDLALVRLRRTSRFRAGTVFFDSTNLNSDEATMTVVAAVEWLEARAPGSGEDADDEALARTDAVSKAP